MGEGLLVMPSALPYYRHFTGDYACETRHFSTLEHGAYRLLMDAYWDNGGALPNDPARLRRITGTSKHVWATIEATIFSQFFQKDGMLFHEKLEKELSWARDRVESARASGRASGASRRGDEPRTNVERTLNERSSVVERTSNSSESESSSSFHSEEEVAPATSTRKVKTPAKKKPEPFNPTLLPLPIFVLWKAIVELRWKDDGVPDHHAREIVEVATWLYEKRNATLDQFKQWVGWWFKSPDSMGSKNGGTRPWPKNVRNTWDTCFAAPSGGNGAGPIRKVDPEVKARFEAERERRMAEEDLLIAKLRESV